MSAPSLEIYVYKSVDYESSFVQFDLYFAGEDASKTLQSFSSPWYLIFSVVKKNVCLSIFSELALPAIKGFAVLFKSSSWLIEKIEVVWRAETYLLLANVSAICKQLRSSGKQICEQSKRLTWRGGQTKTTSNPKIKLRWETIHHSYRLENTLYFQAYKNGQKMEKSGKHIQVKSTTWTKKMRPQCQCNSS